MNKRPHVQSPILWLIAVASLSTWLPHLATSWGICFQAFGSNIGAIPYLSWQGPTSVFLMDINSLFTVTLTLALAWLYGRFAPGRPTMILGLAIFLAGITSGTMWIPLNGPTDLNPNSMAYAITIARLGSMYQLLTGIILARWGGNFLRRNLILQTGSGILVLATAWFAMVNTTGGSGQLHLIASVLPLTVIGLGILAGLLLFQLPALRRHEYFHPGLLAALIPFTVAQWHLAHPGNLEGHGLHEVVLMHWVAWLIPLACLSFDLMFTIIRRSKSFDHQYLRAVIDTIPHFIFARNDEGRFTLVNQAVADFYGRKVHEIEGELLADIHPDQDQAELYLKEDQQALANHDPLILPAASTVDNDGREIYITSLKKTLPGYADRQPEILGVSIEVTDQIQAEKALAGRLEFERTIAAILEIFVHCTCEDMDHSLDTVMDKTTTYTHTDRMAIYHFDADNSDAKLLHGFESGHSPGCPHLPTHLSSEHLAWITQMFHNRLFLTAGSQNEMPSEGHSFWLDLGLGPESSLLAVPIFQGRTLWGFLLVSADAKRTWYPEDSHLLRSVADLFITAYSRLEAERVLQEAMASAQQSSRAKGEFLANMSHEIRTPLNCVIGLTDLLGDMDPSPGQAQYLEMIRLSGTSLLNLINDILDLSKIESGHLELDPLPTSLRTIVDEIAGLAAFNAQAKGLDLICRLAPGCPVQVVIDPVRLRQVLTNLLNNATKFTRKGHIYLNVEPVGGTQQHPALRFEVSDTGIGIEPDKLERIFDKFTQAEAGTTRRFGGTGLGLSISQQLVELMGGHIHAESTPGKGSAFSFTIPVEVTEGPAPAITDPVGGKKHVLVMAGNSLDGEVLAEQVRLLGHHCRVATSDQAVRGAFDDNPDCSFILLDASLEEKGTEPINTYLDSLAPDNRPQVILLSNLSSLKREQEQQNRGFAGTLIKPINTETLATVLAGKPDFPQQMVQALPCSTQVTKTNAVSLSLNINNRTEGNEGPLILLAEDNPFNQKVAVSMLGILGCRVEIAATGVEAVAMVQDKEYDLVFMDCQMPEMDGYEATRRIRALPGDASGVPVVAMTANVMSGDRKACFDAGMDDFLSKPISKAMLVDTLERHVGTQQSQK